jgi:hypothetical protein
LASISTGCNQRRAQAESKLLDDLEGRHPLAPFEKADVGPVNAGLVREGFLAEACGG